jgi:hypothetical protein
MEQSREQKMEAELKARKLLRQIEGRRERSIALVVKNKHVMYDAQRTKLLAKTDPELVKLLVEENDLSHSEYLARQVEEVAAEDVTELVE